MKLLSDRIQEFIDWLEANTDFSDWDEKIKMEVHKQLITFMISDKVEQQHEWEWYMNGSFCKKCGAAIGSGTPCR